MRKVIVDVYAPAWGVQYDAVIPCDSQLLEVVMLLVSICNNIAGQNAVICENLLLCNRENGEVFDLSMTVQKAGIRNGSELLLT